MRLLLCLAIGCLACAAGVPVNATVRGQVLQINGGDVQIAVSLAKSFNFAVYDTTYTPAALILKSSPQAATFSHFEGAYEPFYEGYLFREGAFLDNGAVTSVSSWNLDAAAGTVSLRLATTSRSRSAAVVFSGFQQRQFAMSVVVYNDTTEALEPIHLSFPAVTLAFDASDTTEGYYGFGQRWQGNNQRGNVLKCWTEDGAWSFLEKPNDTVTDFPVRNATYMPSPLLFSTLGYALVVNTSYRTDFDLAHSSKTEWTLTTETYQTEVVFFLGQSPAASLWMFTQWRGGPTLIPPPFEFAPWKQMGSTIPGATDLQVTERMIADDIPFSLCQGYVHFFPRGGQVGNIPQLTAENAAFHALGIKSTCYFNPYVATDYQPLYNEAEAKGYLTKSPKGKPFTFRYMNFYSAQVDFTFPDAVTWYQNQMAAAIDMGFDGWMYDFGEYTPIDSISHDGSNGLKMHNDYPALYQKAVHDLLVAPPFDSNPNDTYAPPYVAFHRAGYTPTGRYMWAHWTGDPSADWSEASGLPAQIAGCLSSGLLGVSFCGSDMGGYVCQLRPANSPSPELLARWVQYGVFAGIMRDETQGSDCKDRAQLYTNELTFTVWRKYAKLRTALFPYIYTAAHEAATTGLPITRHHLLSFPSDPVALNQSYQYMFGPSFLVAPVIVEGSTYQQVYLPRGEDWLDVGSNVVWDTDTGRFRIGYTRPQEGGQSVRVDAAVTDAPLFVRAGTIVATLDPSVDTVNNKTAGAVNAVVTMEERTNVTHLWVFPDGSNSASGATWDGDFFSLAYAPPSDGAAGSAYVLKVTRVAQSDRTYIAQVPALAPPPCGLWDVTTARTALSALQMTDVVSVWSSTGSGYFWDPTQRVIWIRMPGGVSSVSMCMSSA